MGPSGALDPGTMGSKDSTDRLIRICAAVLGIFATAALIFAARPAGGHGGVLPARLRFSADQDGPVAVSPVAPRPLLVTGPLRPGGSAAATLRLRNQTGERLAVGLRARPETTALDGIARVRLLAGRRVLADGTLESLRAGSPGAVALAPGAGAAVRVVVSIPAEVETGYEGAEVGVVLEPVEEQLR